MLEAHGFIIKSDGVDNYKIDLIAGEKKLEKKFFEKDFTVNDFLKLESFIFS